MELGETLPAANLGYAFLNEGFIDEAQAVLATAMAKPDYHENVTHALAEIESRKRAESNKLEELLQDAKRQRGFLELMGNAILETDAPHEVNGVWMFPVGEINLIATLPGVCGRKRREDDQGWRSCEHPKWVASCRYEREVHLQCTSHGTTSQISTRSGDESHR